MEAVLIGGLHGTDIGICGNDSKCACEVLDKVKAMGLSFKNDD